MCVGGRVFGIRYSLFFGDGVVPTLTVYGFPPGRDDGMTSNPIGIDNGMDLNHITKTKQWNFLMH